MKNLIGVLFILLVFSGKLIAESCAGASCIPQKLRTNCVEEQDQGCIDWTNGIIYAVGYGVGKSFPSKQRAGKIDAMRNLLEMVKGVNLDSQTTVEQNRVVSDKVVTRAKGNLKWVQVVGSKDVQDDTVAVTVRMYMKNLWPILLGQESFSNKSYKIEKRENDISKETKERAKQIYTGLIVDSRSTKLSPALSPKIQNEKGEEIYGSAYVSRDFATTQGMIGYAKSLEQAKSNERIGNNPLVVKAVKSSGKNNSSIVVSNEDAELISELGKTLSFLRETRVVAIVD